MRYEVGRVCLEQQSVERHLTHDEPGLGGLWVGDEGCETDVAVGERLHPAAHHRPVARDAVTVDQVVTGHHLRPG